MRVLDLAQVSSSSGAAAAVAAAAAATAAATSGVVSVTGNHLVTEIEALVYQKMVRWELRHCLCSACL